MPQGRRKVPFSAKQKKLQLQNKRRRRAGGLTSDDADEAESVRKINQQPRSDGRSRGNRYALQFFNESKEEIQKRKELAWQTIVPVSGEELEIDIDNYFLPGLDFPRRPPWNYEMSKEELDARENRYFIEYVNSVRNNFRGEELSYFELNLETWRQLWRVIEMSDVILFIVDLRYAALMFPPSLYTYVVESLGKDMILVLNKADLIPAELVVAWKHFFLTKFPALHIVIFTSYPTYNLHGNSESIGVMKNQRRRGRMRMAVEGAQKLLEKCHEIVKDQVDLTSWNRKITEEKMIEYDDTIEIGETIETKSVDTSFHEHVKFRDGILTIGCVGQPNVGKSSVINALMGKKVVSVSKTPGHTKHFQTIYITPNIKLCDCPGLVFPSKVPKVLQVLMGSFPIAQLREPYTTIRYLAERLDLIRMLRIQHPENDDEWSAMDICDGWAKLRGFFTARAARPDTSRAANHLLRLALDGKICLCLRPCGYSKNRGVWKNHPDIEEILWIQALSKSESSSKKCDHVLISSEEETVDDKGEETNDSESGDDSDNESEDDDNDDDSETEVVASNKFALLGEEH